MFRLMADYISVSGKYKDELIKRGIVYNDGFSPFTQSFEHGHYGHGELLIRYMPNPDAFKVLTREFIGRPTRRLSATILEFPGMSSAMLHMIFTGRTVPTITCG